VSLRWLLDTNVLSVPVAPHPDPGVVARIAERRDAIAVPSVAWHELWYGTARLPRGRRRDALEDYLQRGVRGVFPVLPYDEAAAVWHATERARLESLGAPRPFADGQIAAIAATHDLILVTANVRDFVGWSGLVVEDWRAAPLR
jgi:tRNA(fMet)-specific endonuclease VapC